MTERRHFFNIRNIIKIRLRTSKPKRREVFQSHLEKSGRLGTCYVLQANKGRYSISPTLIVVTTSIFNPNLTVKKCMPRLRDLRLKGCSSPRESKCSFVFFSLLGNITNNIINVCRDTRLNINMTKRPLVTNKGLIITIKGLIPIKWISVAFVSYLHNHR